MKIDKSKTIQIAVLLALLASCSAPTPIPESEGADAKIYVESCGGCHSVPHPKRHTIAQWDHLLDLMERRIRERGLPEIEPGKRESIRAYLSRNAR